MKGAGGVQLPEQSSVRKSHVKNPGDAQLPKQSSARRGEAHVKNPDDVVRENSSHTPRVRVRTDHRRASEDAHQQQRAPIAASRTAGRRKSMVSSAT